MLVFMTNNIIAPKLFYMFHGLFFIWDILSDFYQHVVWDHDCLLEEHELKEAQMGQWSRSPYNLMRVRPILAMISHNYGMENASKYDSDIDRATKAY